MLRVTLRNLFARKVRLVMSAFAIVLGVAFVGGSLIFTDAMGGAFDDIIEGSTSDVEVGIPGATDFDSLQDNRTIPASVLHDLEKVPGAEAVRGSLQQQAVFVIGDNDKVVGGTGPPGLAFNYTEARNMAGEPILTLEKGSWPQGDGEIVLDESTAEKAGYDVGDEVPLITGGTPPSLKQELVGIASFGNGGTNGATLTIFETKAMQKLFYGGRDVYSSVSLEAAPGVTQDELRDAAARVLPKDLEARTGTEVAETNKKDLRDSFLKYIRTFMLVFAGISLVVGAFLIINTFSILVAQRARELALLRALGSSRRQITRAVMIEALAVGVIGSTVGLFAGIGLAQVLRAVFGAVGLDLSQAEFPVRASTVVWCYVLGIVVTVVASYLPARRASHLPPIAALRDDVALPESTLRKRVLVGLVLGGLGVLSVVLGFVGSGSKGLMLVGAGLFLVLIGAALCSPAFARPVIGAFGVVYRRLFTKVGQLATQNSLRNPRRTAATSSALMIGIALVTMVSIFGASLSKSTESTVAKSLKAQFVVSNAIGVSFSPDVARQVAALDDVETVAPVQQVFPAKVDGGTTFIAGVDAADLQQAIDITDVQGKLTDLSPTGIAISDDTADSKHLAIGDTVKLELQAGVQQLRVTSVFKSDPAVPGEYLVDDEALAKGGLAHLDTMVFVVAKSGADLDRVREALDDVVKDLPTITVKDPDEYANEQKGQIDFFLNLVYGLLGLSIVIAILGVVNTLGLSVIERTREVGLLRAVGLSRSQLRLMMTLEAVVIAMFGALLGIVVGTGFGVSLVTALKDQGISDLAIPWGSLIMFVVLAGVVGILAAVWPGRRAARLDVLKAIATE